MDRLEQLRKTSYTLNLESTSKYLNNLKNERTFKIISPYPTIHGVDCKIQMDEDGTFNYRVRGFNRNSPVEPVHFQDIGYGFAKPFVLVDKSTMFSVPFGVGSLSINFSASDSCTGKLNELVCENNNEYYCRCILTPSIDIENLATYFMTEAFIVKDSLRVAGLLKLKIQGIEFHLFDYELDGKNRLFIDSRSACNYDLFKSIVNSFIIQFAIVSGYLLRDHAFYMFAADANFAAIKHHAFAKMPRSKHGLEAVRPRDLIDIVPELQTRESRYLQPYVMENLITMALKDVQFFRACTIIAESHGHLVEIKASTYAVALETLKNIIIAENEDKINPIKSKTISKQLRAELKSVIDKYDDVHFNNKAAIIQKIDVLNQVPNTDSFVKMFELIGLSINNEDKEILKKRNDFLHGRIPFEDERRDINKNELAKIVMKLHLLLCAVILKRADYHGYLVNNIRLKFRELTNEPAYRIFSAGTTT